MKRYLFFLLLPLLSSCSLYPSVPMESMRFNAGGTPAKHLIILMGGRGAGASYFADKQWVEMARQHGVQADFIAPYAHFGYYVTGELTSRLNKDIIQPAKKRGYKSISLVGISMGGLGSLLYDERFPEDIDRIYLFAPYLGDADTHSEIRAAGGLKNWQIKMEDESDWHHSIWQRLKLLTDAPETRNKLFLGIGEQDKMRGIDILEQNLPPEHVIKVPGGHKDVVFTRLWQIMLERGFVNQASPVTASVEK